MAVWGSNLRGQVPGQGQLGQIFLHRTEALRTRVPGQGSVDVGVRVVISTDLKELFKLGRQRGVRGAIHAATETHKHFVYVLMREVNRDYEQKRRALPSRRDARRRERLLEEYINPESATNTAQAVPRVAEIRTHVGFSLQYDRVLDQNVERGGFPYWRSVEYGFAGYSTRGLFTTNPDWPVGRRKGRYSAPSPTRIGRDPRLPQFSSGAEVFISGFPGYHFIRDGLARGRQIMMNRGPGGYGSMLILQLPQPLLSAATQMQSQGMGLNVRAGQLVNRRTRRFAGRIP